MHRILITLLSAGLLAAPTAASAQATSSAEPFAVGTFAFDGREGLGLVLRQQLVVELNAANNNLQMEPGFARMPMPDDMLQLIGLYEYTASRTGCTKSSTTSWPASSWTASDPPSFTT